MEGVIILNHLSLLDTTDGCVEIDEQFLSSDELRASAKGGPGNLEAFFK